MTTPDEWRKPYYVSFLGKHAWSIKTSYKWNQLVSEVKEFLPDVLYSTDIHVMWLIKLELSFLLMKYGHFLNFSETGSFGTPSPSGHDPLLPGRKIRHVVR